MPSGLKGNKQSKENEKVEVTEQEEEAEKQKVRMHKRRSLNGFWEKFKDKLIDLFKEDEDKHL